MQTERQREIEKRGEVGEHSCIEDTDIEEYIRKKL